MFKRADLMIYILLVLIIAATAIAVFGGNKQGDTVIIKMNGEFYASYPLSENRTVTLDGGRNVIVIDHGVYMEYSDCPDKSCVKQGKITRAGESIICLPNRVTVEISGNNKPEVDVVVK